MTISTASRALARTEPLAGPADGPILESKVTVPDVPGWAIQRPRITRLITRGTRWCPLTVVTGPPGAGKTMAATLWAAARPGAVAWLSLDEYDNRPSGFWSYVVAALRRPALPFLTQGLPLPGGGSMCSCCGLPRCWPPRIRR